MKKTLVIQYTPRENSKTKQLLDSVEALLPDSTEIIKRDLAAEPVPFLTPEVVSAYHKRGYDNQILEPMEVKTLEDIDRIADEFKDSDIIIMAYPIYNYSFPAAIKAWIDIITQKGKAFKEGDYGPEGQYHGKHILVLNASGGTLLRSHRDLSTPLLEMIMELMGIKDVQFFGLYGTKYLQDVSDKIEEISEDIKPILDAWYMN